MSKITTNDCKNKLVDLFPDTESKDWKRTKKYKNEDGLYCRDFENHISGETATLLESNNQLVLVSKEQYSFVMYKYDQSHFEWLVYFGVDEEEEEQDCENLRDKITTILSSNNLEDKLDELDAPNYSCDDDNVSKIYKVLVNNGFIYNKAMMPPTSVIFDDTNFITPVVSNKIYSQVDLMKIMEHESNNILPQQYHPQLKNVLSNLAKEELEKFLLGFSQLNYSTNSHVLKETNLELITRIANPSKPNPTSMTIQESLRKKMGF